MSLPLRGATPTDAYSGRRLLHRALVVVHFSPVLKIADASGAGIADFQDDLRAEYPEVAIESEYMLHFEVRPEGVQTRQQAVPVWRFADVGRRWRMSLTSESVSLDVGDGYLSADDLGDRIQRIIQGISAHFKPAQARRVGVRFANAAALDEGEDPRQECARELVSISGHPDLLQSDLLWRFAVDEGTLILRSGVLFPGTSYDPGIFEPKNERNWYLDIDVARDAPLDFSAPVICAAIEGQVKRVHAVYRWAMPNGRAVGE